MLIISFTSLIVLVLGAFLVGMLTPPFWRAWRRWKK